MQLKALKPFRYAKQNLKPGDVFDAKEIHVKVLTTSVHGKLALAQKAEDQKPKTKAPEGRYQTRADHQDLEKLTKPRLIELANATGVEVDGKDTKAAIVQKLRYQRRDMRAE